MTRALNQPQFDALRYAAGRQLYADDVNNGNGNRRRTLLWLIDHGLLTWDPIYYGRVALTDLGKQKLAEARERMRAARRPSILRRDPPGTLRIKDVGDRRVITLTGLHQEKP